MRIGSVRVALAAAAAALLATLALGAPAPASPVAPGSVGEGKNISVFHNSDFVAAFGYGLGRPLTVDLYRGPHRIATAFGPAVSTPEGAGLEINHGPAGAATQGDCWEDFTPDVLPNDRIVVRDGTVTDEVLVDGVTITGAPIDEVSTTDPTDVTIEGRAAFADGTPIPLDLLSGESRHDGPRFRAEPNAIERISGTQDGWRAVYQYPYRVVQVKEPLTWQERKQAILNGDHAVGYGHVVPPPPETQIAEFPAAGGPALDCANPSSPHYAPAHTNAVTTSDDPMVTQSSGSLVLSGVAGDDVTGVDVTLSDTGSETADVTVAATGLTAGPGQRAWSAEFTRDQVLGLADGTLTASGTYGLQGGGAATGAVKQLRKEAVPPVLTATPRPKTYSRPVTVALISDGGEEIRYTTDGSRPDNDSKTYRGTRIYVKRTSTIRALATDAAGARTYASFRSVIR